jgi:hypothetical protein
MVAILWGFCIQADEGSEWTCENLATVGMDATPLQILNAMFLSQDIERDDWNE